MLRVSNYCLCLLLYVCPTLFASKHLETRNERVNAAVVCGIDTLLALLSIKVGGGGGECE